MERIVEQVKFPIPKMPKLLNVAAYARVSSGKDAMLHSLSAQVSYYSEMIENHPGWKFCGVYADEALTGTKDNRENFQKLLKECKAGRIDLIITKSISRFARNTVTLLETVRELKSIGVDVYFEEQNIHSISADGELMLTILASYAQEESLSASENCKWRIRNDFKKGKVWNVKMLGYKRTPDGCLEIVPDEAEIVRLIFDKYLSGVGLLSIANMLNEMKAMPKQCGKWTNVSVGIVLRNEKYTGDLLLQKTYSENHLTKRKMINNGCLPKYFVEDAHQAIIDHDTFNAVQERLNRHKDKYAPLMPPNKNYPFTGKIRCSCCGKNYRRKTTSAGHVWICSTFNSKGKKYCPTAKQIPEPILYEKICEILEIKEFDETVVKKHIEKIIVPAPNELIFIFLDGTEIKTTWQDRSRSESWTPEMKQAARERRLKCSER